MAIDGLDDAQIRDILARTRRVAVVGASTRVERPSHAAMLFFQKHGIEVVPVNPGHAGGMIAGVRVAAGLEEALPLDLVDVFRASAHAGAVVDKAVTLGAHAIWMQLGVIDVAAAARARSAGLAVVMDRCPMIEWPRLGLGRGDAARFS